MRWRLWALAGIMLLSAAAGTLLAVGRTDYEIGLQAVLEIWADAVHDADHVGLTVTRVLPQGEMEIGREIEREIKMFLTVVDDPQLQEYVQEVGGRLIANVHRKDIAYRFHVVEMPEPNAFAIPGGGIFVTTGMIDLVESEAELAAIVGHEISHVDLRHCIERLQYQLALRRVVGDDLAAIARVAYELVRVGFSEQQELEADIHGIILSAAAGYDPREGLTVFDRMAGNITVELTPAREEREPTLMVEEMAGAMLGVLRDYFATHPPFRGRARELSRAYRRNEPHWLGRRFYLGRSNHASRVSRTTDERSDEWFVYRASPEVIDCILASGIVVPTTREGCPHAETE